MRYDNQCWCRVFCCYGYSWVHVGVGPSWLRTGKWGRSLHEHNFKISYSTLVCCLQCISQTLCIPNIELKYFDNIPIIIIIIIIVTSTGNKKLKYKRTRYHLCNAIHRHAFILLYGNLAFILLQLGLDFGTLAVGKKEVSVPCQLTSLPPLNRKVSVSSEVWLRFVRLTG